MNTRSLWSHIAIWFVLGVSSPVVANELPPVLAEPLAALLSATAEEKERACDLLIDSYLPFLRAGEAIAIVDRAVVDSLSPEGRSALAARLAIAGVFSSLQRSCIESLADVPLQGQQAEFVTKAKNLYRGLAALAGGHTTPSIAWDQVASDLREGWHYFPSLQYAGLLETALRNSHDKRGLFEFMAYRYFDESEPSPFRYVGLFFRWLFLPKKEAFGREIELVKRSIKDDIRKTSPGVVGLPWFGGETMRTASGEARSLSFSDPNSVLYKRRALFAFFDTTCPYCVDELKALGEVVTDRAERGRRPLAVVGIQRPNNLPPVLSALAPFERKLGLPFPLMTNAASGMCAAYNVRSVPLLIFFDATGNPLWTVALRGQGRLAEKLGWFVDDFLGDERPVRSTTGAAGAVRVDVEFYLDPSHDEAQSYLAGELPIIARSLDVEIASSLHDLRTDAVEGSLENRLAALRVLRSQSPVAIIGTRVIQGLETIRRDLRSTVAASASTRQR